MQTGWHCTEDDLVSDDLPSFELEQIEAESETDAENEDKDPKDDVDPSSDSDCE